jgi:hypothetical protein
LNVTSNYVPKLGNVSSCMGSLQLWIGMGVGSPIE